jgi:catechol 2,3-dioxygenase-like lactoylglutathione lyase family enzyme
MATWQLSEPHHLGLTVSDIERSVRFYRDVLGLTLMRRRQTDADYVGQQTGYPGVRLEVASFQLSATGRPSLELVQYATHAGPPSDPATNRAGNAHLCFQVDQLHAAYESLRNQGVSFRSPPVAVTSGPNQGGFVVYLLDPDGFTIELFQPPPAAEECGAAAAAHPGRCLALGADTSSCREG